MRVGLILLGCFGPARLLVRSFTRTAAGLKRRPLVVGTVVLVIVPAVQALLKRGSEWEEVYIRAGRQ